jgi:aminoglycoside/choline kinase family phosphotransferase
MQQKIENLVNVDFATFKQWFDWTGLQRHLKVLGVFSRLKLRDNKPQYLNDIPSVISYFLQVTSEYKQFALFDTYLRQEVLPLLENIIKEEKVV